VSDLTRQILDSLLPQGTAWRLRPDGHLSHLLDGVADNMEAVRAALGNLGLLRDPWRTPYLEELERDYGIDPNPQLTEAQRRATLALVMFARLRRGTVDDMQEALDRAGLGDGGLGLHVYPNDPAVDPGLFAEGGAQTWCGQTTGVCGYSIDGIANEDWAGIAHDGAQFCAIGLDACATSPDGTTWTVQAGLGAGDWKAIAWNGSVFCAVGTDVCATSPTGVTWTPRSIGVNTWQDIAWAAVPNLFVACSVSGTASNNVATSPDGTTWTPRTVSMVQMDGVAYSPTLGLWVVVSSKPSRLAYATSTDTITWTTGLLPIGARWRAVSWNPVAELFVAISDGPTVYCMTSPDGTTWTLRPSMPPRQWTALAWSGTALLAVGFDGACASTDGILWEEQLGGVLAFCGTHGGGVYIVNGDVVTQASGYLGCGNAEALCGFIPSGGGDSTAVCGRYITLVYTLDVIPSPTDPSTWPLVFFIAASATEDAEGYITDLELIDVPANQRATIVELVMRWKPAASWAALMVTFS
jgi:hypothetical protein